MFGMIWYIFIAFIGVAAFTVGANYIHHTIAAVIAIDSLFNNHRPWIYFSFILVDNLTHCPLREPVF